jgi:hypothetical protein
MNDQSCQTHRHFIVPCVSELDDDDDDDDTEGAVRAFSFKYDAHRTTSVQLDMVRRTIQ